MRSHETGSKLSKIDLNIVLFITLPMEFIFYHSCLRSVTWFGKLFSSQKHRSLNYFFACNLAISDVMSYRFVREL